ncbi:MAG: RHS repeat protein [Pirellulales bacterium]|nr:RHS repeat protein [Pirellulales bacterium]
MAQRKRQVHCCANSLGGAQSFIEEWHYEDEFNLVVRHIDRAARHTAYLRDAAGNVREVRQAIGNLDDMHLPAVDDLTTSYTYTSSGAAGLLDTRTDPDGRVTDVDYLGATGLVSAITLGAGSEVAGTRQFFYDAETRVMTHSLDELGRRTDYVYDALDRLTEWWEPDPDPTAHGDADRPVWVYDYCACGRLTSILDPEYTITSYRFHPQRGWLSEAKILGSDLETYRQEFYGYDATGRLTSVTTGLGQETSYLYDDAGRLVKLTLPDPDGAGGAARPAWEYFYDDANLLIAVRDPLARQTDYHYDNLFRLERVELPAVGGVRPEWNYAYWDDGAVYSITDPEGGTTLLIPDEAGRLQRVELDASLSTPNVTLAQYAYDGAGNLRFATDELGRVTERVYDARGRLAELLEPDPDGAGSLPRPVIAFTYDAVGNLKTLTDPNQNTTEWFYDGLDRPIEEVNELGASRFYAYDLLGRVTKFTDRLERVTEYEYNPLSQVTSEIWKNALGATVRTIESTYNAAALLETIYDSGSLSYEFAYDGLDRLSYSSSFGGGLPFTVLENSYDALGQRTELKVYRNFTLDHTNAYEYDALGRMTNLAQTGATVAAKSVGFTYLKDGRLDTLARSNGVTSDFTYNDRGQLTSLVHAGVGAGSISHAYTYQGPRVQTYTNVHGTVTYGYDNLDQLKSANWPGSANDENYSYDEAGNRTLDGASSYTVGVNNRLVSDGVYRYGYDAEGNRTSRYVDADSSGTLNAGDTDVTLYDYDHRNRLAKVTHKPSFGAANDRVISYLYDPFDRRIGRDLDADGNGTIDRRERWVNDGSEAILEFVDPDGTGPAAMALSKRFLNGPAVDQILAQEDLSKSINAADRVLWHLSDSQGTVRDLVDNTGDLVERYRYDAFGELIVITDATGIIVATQPRTNFLYNGMWRDPETGFYATMTRWYDPRTGRWIHEDWIGFRGGDYNLHRYVENSPTNATDPSGLAPWKMPDGDGDYTIPPRNTGGPVDTKPTRPPVQAITNPQYGDYPWFFKPAGKPPAAVEEECGKINPVIIGQRDMGKSQGIGGGQTIKVTDIPDDFLVGSQGAGPCIIMIISVPVRDKPGNRDVIVSHCYAADNPFKSLEAIGGFPVGCHAAVAGGDGSRESNTELLLVLTALQSQGAIIDGYFSGSGLWVDNRGNYHTYESDVKKTK